VGQASCLPRKSGVAELRDDSCGVGILPAWKYKGWASCPSHKNSKIIPQICNAVI
jgi:hypothetical protein